MTSCGSGGSGNAPPEAGEEPIQLQAKVQIEVLSAGLAKFYIFLAVIPAKTPLEAELVFWFQIAAKGRPEPCLPAYRADFNAPGSYEIYFESGHIYSKIHATLQAQAGGKEAKAMAVWPTQ